MDEASDVELEMHVEVDLHALESYEDDLDLQDNNDDENNNDLMKDKFLSRDGRLWNPNCIGQRRKLRHNVFTVKKTGPTAETKDLNEYDTFKLIMSSEIVALIQRETNRKASKMMRPTTFTCDEIYAFIGLNCFAGAIKSDNENYKDLWIKEAHPVVLLCIFRPSPPNTELRYGGLTIQSHTIHSKDNCTPGCLLPGCVTWDRGSESLGTL